MSSSSNSSGGGNPFAWLGLMKWSLSYVDGTTPSSPDDITPMSEEDRKFLEAVMADGVIDEGKRMKEILVEVTEKLDSYRNNENENSEDEEKEEVVCDLLLELRDIVEQIDYARAFMSMGGLSFVLGCASQNKLAALQSSAEEQPVNESDEAPTSFFIPISIRQHCMGILSTMAQNNPPVQDRLLRDLDGLSVLGKLFFEESAKVSLYSSSDSADTITSVIDKNGKLRARIIQAISCAIRGHEGGEETFCDNVEFRNILDLGLGALSINLANASPPTAAAAVEIPMILQKRCLFLLRALVTSDTSSRDRVRAFSAALRRVIDILIASTPSSSSSNGDDVEENISYEKIEVRELTLGLLLSLLRQKKSVNVILEARDSLASKGVFRIASLRKCENEEVKQLTEVELGSWEELLLTLSRAEPDIEVASNEIPLMIADTPENDDGSTLPQ